MLLGLMMTAAGTQLHLFNKKKLEAVLRLGNDFISAQSAAAWRARSSQLCLPEALYSPAGKDVRLAEGC